MLSIIVSSCDADQLAGLKQSVSDTVGTDYEIVVIENENARFGLTEAYNLGASQAKYPFLLFVHEDVVFKTKDWGKILVDHLKNLDNAGVIGIAGTAYKPFVPSSWAFDRTQPKSFNLLQGRRNATITPAITQANSVNVRRMVCLDGVFLAVRRDVFEITRFDEELKGFHGYDTDFSLTVAEEHKNYFVPDILIQHNSEGKISDQWIANTFRIFNKWKAKLPMSVERNGLDLEFELSAYRVFVTSLVSSTLPVRDKARYATRVTSDAIRKTRSGRFAGVLLRSLGEALIKKPASISDKHRRIQQ